MLTAQNLTYCYPGGARVFSDLNLSIPAGGVYGLLGSNGAGKSTLLYLLAGLLRPKSGTAQLDGIDTDRRLPSTLADIFVVPEEFDLPSVKLEQFVNVNAPFYPRFSREQLNGYLEHFRLTPDIHLGKLSMGQRKKAFIAFALACNTSVLLMDEPTNGLDIPGKSEFRRAAISAMSDDRTMVISTHQVRDLDRILDHVLMVEHGRVVIDAPIARIQERMRFSYAPNGMPMVEPRREGEPETDVNIEALFEFALCNPDMVKSL